MRTASVVAAAAGLFTATLASCGLFFGGVEGETTLDGGEAGRNDVTAMDACPPGTQQCGAACVDTTTTITNCGACGNDCTMGGTKPLTGCVASKCIDCDPKVIDFKTSADNCGSCGHSCQGSTCANGLCEKQLLFTTNFPRAVAADGQTVYFGGGDTKVYALANAPDAGPPAAILSPNAYTLDLAPFPGGVGVAHTNGATLAYLDGGSANVAGYEGEYGATVQGGLFWWTSCYPTSLIRHSALDGTSVTLTSSDIGSGSLLTGAQAIAVEGMTAFWTNTTSHFVMRGDPDAAIAIVAPINVPRPLQSSYRLVKVGTDLIWTEPSTTDPANDGRVVRAPASGTDASTPLATGLGNPQYLATDGTYIFWTNTGAGTVSRIKADGSEPSPTDIVPNAPQAMGIAVDGKFVYFSESRVGGGIYRVAK